MQDLQTLLSASMARHHHHLCPRQVVGVRIGMYAFELFALSLPTTDKRLYTFVETNGCLIDGITAATGCWVGNRTMRVMDYGKSAATFVDTQNLRAIRIAPTCDSRTLALGYAPNAPDRWHAQLEAYKVMPNAELLTAFDVVLDVSMEKIISQHGKRVVCNKCGEDIINEREVRRAEQVLCQPFAEGAYYSIRNCVEHPKARVCRTD